MELATRKQSMQGPRDADTSVDFLLAVEVAHSQVEPCIVAHEAIMAHDELADTAQFSVIRLRLAQANLTRTQVAREACSHLISITPIGQAEPLRDLQQSEIEHFQMISDHIRQWTSQAVQEDWRGYCDATPKSACSRPAADLDREKVPPSSLARSSMRRLRAPVTAKRIRRPARLEAVECCTVVREDGSLGGGVLVNLSDEGFCIESNHPLELGERIEVCVPGLGRFAGIVRWLNRSRRGGVLEPYVRGAYDS